MGRGEAGKLVLDKTNIFGKDNCYIYKRGGTNSKNWQFYYWDADGGENFRIRKSLKTNDFALAQSIAEQEYIQIKAKIQNNESINKLTIAELTEAFLEKKKSQISPMPHAGVTEESYRVLKNRCEKLKEYLGKNTKVDQLKRDAFANYEQWRMDGRGGNVPQTKTTIKTELSTFKSIIQTIAINEKRLISRLPDMPEIRVPRREGVLRRNNFREEELRIFLKAMNEWKEEKTSRSTAAAHRKIVACAIEVMLNSGIRFGAAKRIRWRNIRVNHRDSLEQQKYYRIITVEAANNKTGKEYECNCEVAMVLKLLKGISRFTTPSDYLFCNQRDGRLFSSRIWSDSWEEIIERSNLEEETGRKFSYYSLRHTYATNALANRVPLQLLASNMDTSTKYIQDHYYHHQPEILTAELNPEKKKRKLTGAEMYDMHFTNK